MTRETRVPADVSEDVPGQHTPCQTVTVEQCEREAKEGTPEPEDKLRNQVCARLDLCPCSSVSVLVHVSDDDENEDSDPGKGRREVRRE